MTASRALGRLYINDTARPIMVSALADGVDWGYPARLIIKGTVIVGFYSAYYGWPAGVSGVVPPGASYMVDIAGASGYLYKWIELR